jgi:hypothetical protein
MKNIYTFLCLFLGIGFFQSIVAQGISVQEDPAVRSLMDSRKYSNFKKDRTFRAWSVQVAVARDKYEILQKMQEVRAMFRDEIGIKIDWTYEEPYYRLNAGAYFLKLEANALLMRITQKYPDAYLFKNSQVKATDF